MSNVAQEGFRPYVLTSPGDRMDAKDDVEGRVMIRVRGLRDGLLSVRAITSKRGNDLLRGERFYAVFVRAHSWLLVRTGGRPSYLTARLRCLVLETTGRRSNRLRRVPLLFMPDRGAYVVLASNFGREQAPSWWKNLQARPEASVRLAGRVIAVRARELDGDERETVLERAMAYNKQWRSYSARMRRTLPVIRLEPVTVRSPRESPERAIHNP